MEPTLRRTDDGQLPHSQTLDRGVRVLEVLAEAERALPVAELAGALGVHRSIVYRILRTLEDHRLVDRASDGSYRLGVGLSALARGVATDLRSASLPEMAAVAEDLGMTCFLTVPDRDDCVTVHSVEPRHALAAVAQRPGSRHPLKRGAPGLALLAGGPPLPGERDAVTKARRDGYAVSSGEVIPGMTSVSAPVLARGVGAIASVAVVFADTWFDRAAIGERLVRAARVITEELG